MPLLPPLTPTPCALAVIRFCYHPLLLRRSENCLTYVFCLQALPTGHQLAKLLQPSACALNYLPCVNCLHLKGFVTSRPRKPPCCFPKGTVIQRPCLLFLPLCLQKGLMMYVCLFWYKQAAVENACKPGTETLRWHTF